MNRIIAAGAAAALLALSGVPALALTCTGMVDAKSGVVKALTSATDGATKSRIDASYRRAFAVARTQAINAWMQKVKAGCPSRSAFWIRASRTKVEECDRAMGGRFTVCAYGVPAKKLF